MTTIVKNKTIEKILQLRQQQKEAEENGIEPLARLLKVAQGDTHQSGHIAHFLLGLYNGSNYPFDLTKLRCIDQTLFEDCLLVLQMDHTPIKEVHRYFENGSEIWQKMAKYWNIPNQYIEKQHHEKVIDNLQQQIKCLSKQLIDTNGHHYALGTTAQGKSVSSVSKDRKFSL